MSFVINQVKPEDVQNFCARNGGTTVSRNAAEVWAGFLAANGGTGTRLPELEATWLAVNGANGVRLPDLWGNFLKAQGYTGNLQDMLRVYFSSGSAVGTVFSDLLLEDSSYILLESGSGNSLLLEG